MSSLEQYLYPHTDIRLFLDNHSRNEWRHIILTAALYGIDSLQASHLLSFQLIHEEMLTVSKQLVIRDLHNKLTH